MFLRKRLVIISFLFYCFIVNLNAQSFTVSGFIMDNASGEVLIGAYVFCPQTGAGTITNNYGYYALSMPIGTKNLMFINEGYFAQIDTTRINRKKQVDIYLNKMDEDDVQINPFENKIIPKVEPENDSVESIPKLNIKNNAYVENLIKLALERNTKIIDRVQNGILEVPGFQITKMPSLLGEVDVVRALKFLPGVMPGTELTNGLYVRGGGQDQNLVLLDGVPVYNMNHIAGFYSVLNSDGINKISLTKSGFSAKHGGRLSAITDVVMKEGNSKEITGIYSYSPLMLRLELEGPLSRNGKTTFAFSGRRSYLDLLIRPFLNDSNKLWYTLYDFNAKVCHSFNEKSKLFFSVYTGRDRFYTLTSETRTTSTAKFQSRDAFDLNWGNITASARWNKVVNQKMFSSLSLSLTKYRNNFGWDNTSSKDSGTGISTSNFKYAYKNVIRDMLLKWEFDHTANKNHTLHFGVNSSIRGFFPGTVRQLVKQNGKITNDNINGEQKALLGIESALYLEDDIRIQNDFKMLVGSRLVHYTYSGSNFIFIEPRISFNAKIDNDYAIKGSYSMMNQSLHLIADNTSIDLFPTDRWLPATSKIGPQRAQQITLGITKPYIDNYEFAVEGYYKWMSKVVEVKEGATFGLTEKNWEDKLLMGQGWCYGIETFLHKRKGDLTGWMSYSLSWAERKTPGVNRDEKYYFQFDRRHYVNIVAQQKIDDRNAISVNMVFSTGNVQSVPTGKFLDINGNVVYDYPYKNNYRLANTFRIDVGLTCKRNKFLLGYESGYNISVYNLLFRNNPAYVYIDNNSGGAPRAYQQGFLGFIPGISYYTKF